MFFHLGLAPPGAVRMLDLLGGSGAKVLHEGAEIQWVEGVA